MAPKLFQKPLTATVRERLKAHRAAPPTAQHIASLHRLPWPKAPEQEPAEMAKKKKRARGDYDDDFRAKTVARFLKAKESGEETVEAIVADLGITSASLYTWVRKAKAANGAAPAASSATAKGKGKGDLKSVTKQLSEAMEHVAKLKKQLRKMLGDD
jgi:transposase-like protein